MNFKSIALGTSFLTIVSSVTALSADIDFASKSAVSGINGTFGVFGGFADALLYDSPTAFGVTSTDLDFGFIGLNGRLAMPVSERFGAQIDGLVGYADADSDDPAVIPNLRDDEFFQLAGHFFARNEMGLLGVYGDYLQGPDSFKPAFGLQPDTDAYRIAVEGELYANQFTLSGLAGYTNGGSEHFFAEGRVAAYFTDNVKAYAGVEYNEIAVGKLGAEMMLTDTGLGLIDKSSLWVEAQTGGKEHQALMAGLTFRFGGSSSLIDAERCDYAPTWWSVRSGLTNLGNGGNSAPVPLVSDARLKRNIVIVGSLPNGLNLYRFQYHWSEQAFIGVMAQEVLEILPHAVVLQPDGFMHVNYSMIGFAMCKAEEWTWRSAFVQAVAPLAMAA